jgi:hypothetical protein
MKDYFHPFHCPANHGPIGHIAGDNFDLIVHVGEVGARTGAPIIQDTNLITRSEQPINQMRADETPAPRYQTYCHSPSPTKGEALRFSAFRASRGIAH